MVRYGTVRNETVWYDTVRYGMWYCVVWYGIILCHLSFIRNWKMDWNWSRWSSGLYHSSYSVDIFLLKDEVSTYCMVIVSW